MSRRNGTGRPIRLTKRGERVVVALYTAAVLTGAAAALLIAMGIAGWIEGGMK